MLNTNKIQADIDFNKLELTDVSNIIKVKYSTTAARSKTRKWTPDDVERLADYFGHTIAYYYDREEKQAVVYPNAEKKEETKNVANEPCANCAVMQAKIDKLSEDLIESQKETIAALKGEHKKEKPLTSYKAAR